MDRPAAGVTEQAVRAAFGRQAEWCRQLGSPFTAALLDLAAGGLDRSTPVGRRVLDWPGDPATQSEALPLRFAGGLHALARRGRLPGLSAAYPPNPLDGPSLWGAVAEVLATAGDELDPWLDRAPQTNEVARSAPLMAGLMTIVAEQGLPVALFELGASAGLNLLLDRYAYRLGSVDAGVAGSLLLLAPEWRGAAPALAALRVAARRGVDLNPLDVTRAADRERLLAYIWADQAARLARVEAAIALAVPSPPPLDRGDAADWTEAQLDLAPLPGTTRVLMHSIAAQYFPEAVRCRVADHASRVGAQATAVAPFAWLRLEIDPVGGGAPALLLTLWPGGRERVLARASPHGVWVEWLG